MGLEQFLTNVPRPNVPIPKIPPSTLVKVGAVGAALVAPFVAPAILLPAVVVGGAAAIFGWAEPTANDEVLIQRHKWRQQDLNKPAAPAQKLQEGGLGAKEAVLYSMTFNFKKADGTISGTYSTGLMWGAILGVRVRTNSFQTLFEVLCFGISEAIESWRNAYRPRKPTAAWVEVQSISGATANEYTSYTNLKIYRADTGILEQGTPPIIAAAGDNIIAFPAPTITFDETTPLEALPIASASGAGRAVGFSGEVGGAISEGITQGNSVTNTGDAISKGIEVAGDVPITVDTSTDTHPDVATEGVPNVLTGPWSNPGSIQITYGGAIPAVPTQGQKIGTDAAGNPVVVSNPVVATPTTTANPPLTDRQVIVQGFTDIGVKLDGLPLAVGATVASRVPSKADITTAVEQGTCNVISGNNKCGTNPLPGMNRKLDDLIAGLGLLGQAGQSKLLDQINSTLNTVNSKLGSQINGGLSGGITRLSSFLGIDRIFNLLNFLAVLHNASMLSASLKTTLLETLASVGNATGLLQTSEGDNVDLNAVFNQGIETFITSMIGVEAWASMKLTWRKYNSIYRSATNSLNAISSMFNSVGQAVETGAEYTGKIGNALRAAGLVREKAYNYMAEKFNVASSNKYISFQSKIGNVTQVLETINEISENVVEGQQQYTEAVKATNDFQKQLSDAKKIPGIDNKAIKEEADKIKENISKDPTGEKEEGYLSFLTD